MDRTIIALYNNLDDARSVVEALVEAGFSRDRISLVANDSSNQYAQHLNSGTGSGATSGSDDVSSSEGAGIGGVFGALVGLGAMLIPGIGPVIAAGPLVAGLVGAGVGAAAGAATGSITAGLIKSGLDEESAGYFAEGVRRGGTLVAAQADDQWADQVVNIMQQYDPIDINTRAQEWQQTGWTGFDERAQTYDTSQIELQRRGSRTADDEVRAEVVEEELQVGKRQVQKGGVRVHTYVTETPVQEQVNLREEHVTVERRPVNRQATAADMTTGEQTYEFTEMAEEPVVSKTARVVEEVVVKKDVQQHNQTVSDTVRRKDVEVERTGGNDGGFERYTDDFRQHFTTNYGSQGQSYDYYMPAYQYGYMLANDPRYSRYSNWSDVESNARTDWEQQNQGTWDNFKDAIRHSWDRIRGVR